MTQVLASGGNLRTEANPLAAWLWEEWPAEGPAVAVLEGFSGVGKSWVGREVVRRWSAAAVRAEIPDDGIGLEDLLLDVATRFEDIGDRTMSDREDLDLVAGLKNVLRKGALLVVDDAQLMLDPSTRLPTGDLLNLVRVVGDNNGNGRLLLIVNQAPAEGLWLENARRFVLHSPEPGKALAMLNGLLKDRGVEAEIPESKRMDVVRWLGGNPRAMRALVACLGDEPLERLIEIEPDAWLLRDEAVSPQLIQKLEAYFLTRTLDQLDGNSLLLLEHLSVYRKPFRVDAIERLQRIVPDVPAARESLSSRYLIGMSNGYCSVHPVMRRLARVRLSNNPRRETRAHGAAADHFSRRLHGAPSQTNLTAVGEAFVESRYHLLTVGREVEFEAIASVYRRQLLAHYQDLAKIPVGPSARNQLLSTLQAALLEDDRGYARLRIILARLLLLRGNPGDTRIALRQLTVASRESKDLYCWKTRLELTSVIEGLSSSRSVAEQALTALHQSHHWMVYHWHSSILLTRRQDRDALDWLAKALDDVPIQNLYSIYSLSSFVLTRLHRRAEAVELLLNGHNRLGAGDSNSWRLLEEAAFLAAAVHDLERISRVRVTAFDQERGQALVILCDVLSLQAKRRFHEAAALAEKHSSAALVAQAAFSYLCAGEVSRASGVLAGRSLPQNPASSWIRALTALCAGQADLYVEEMSACLGRQLSPEEMLDSSLWLKVWDRVPDRLEPFPAFYFPRLPAALTGLPGELVRLSESGDAVSAIDVASLQLPSNVDPGNPLEAGAGGGSNAPASISFTVEGDLVMSRDVYNVSGQAGAVGPKASAERNTFNQFVGGMDEGELAQLATELSQLRLTMRESAKSAEEDMAVAEVAQAEVAAAAGDTATVERHLAKAGKWALSTATAIGVALAAAAIKAAIGL